MVIGGLVGLGYWLGRKGIRRGPRPPPKTTAHELDANARFHGLGWPVSRWTRKSNVELDANTRYHGLGSRVSRWARKSNVVEMPAWTGMDGRWAGPVELPEAKM